MELLYAVDLDVACAIGERDDPVLDRVLAHVAIWLSRSTEPLPVDALRLDGEQHVVLSRFAAPATARASTWRVLQAEKAWALRLEVRQPLTGVDADFVCRLTVAEVDDAVTLRIVMGRDTSSRIVSAIPLEYLTRPAVLGAVLADDTLCCRTLEQVVTGSPISVDAEAVAEVGRAARASRRLPLLLMDAASVSVERVASELGRQLAGLAQVVLLLDQHTLDEWALTVPEAPVPPRGSRLLWPSLEVRQPAFVEGELAPPKRAATRLLRLIGPFAVAARGRDHAWEETGARARRQHTEELRRRIEEAGQRGDVREQVALLEQQLAARTAELEEYLATFGPSDQAEQQAQALAAAQEESRYWREQYQELSRSSIPEEPLSARAPGCEDDLDDLADFLEKETSSAIVFTARARREWRKSGYPEPAAMRSALVMLAQAAQEWHNKSGDIGRMPDDWLKLRWGLNSAFSDRGLAQAKADRFWFEDRELDRTPHLKLDDHTTPDRVGRVYFAMDQQGWRFVVDHVGLKLYGL